MIELSLIDASMISDLLESFTLRTALILIIILATIIIARVVNKIVSRFFDHSSNHLNVDKTQYVYVRHLINGIIYTLGTAIAILSIPTFKTFAVSILAGAGILAVIVGFASQQAFSNLISGIFIAIFRPFRIGDRIKIGSEMMGTVEDITLRHTVIRSFENKRLLIPNTKISEETIENANYGDDKVCKFLDFGISYDSDINKAFKIIRSEALKHKFFLDNRTDEQKDLKEHSVSVRVIGFGDSSVNIRAWIWANSPPDAFVMGCDLNKSIKERFDREGIEIPFPYRTLVYKKDIKRKRKSK